MYLAFKYDATSINFVEIVVVEDPHYVIILNTNIILISIHFTQIYSQVQQTPKLLAQGPLTTPPLSWHSASVRHVPLSPDAAKQALLLNSTMVNSERTAKYQEH